MADLSVVVQKTDTQFDFWDNFGNSAPILTILSLLQTDITNTTTIISVKCLHFSRNVMLSIGVSRMG